MIEDREIIDLLRNTLRPYIERLGDPEVVAATDARAAASIVKMLLDSCDYGADAPAPNEDTLCRREMLEILREIVREQSRAENAPPGPTTTGRKRCPEAGGLS
jgi:hypothetical protein